MKGTVTPMALPTPTPLEGDFVQVRQPGHWAHNTLMKVESVRSWGCIGIVYGPHDAEYPLRLKHDEIGAVYRKVEVRQ